MNFIKTFFASCLGSLVAMAIIIILCIGFITAAVSGLTSGDSQVLVDDNSVLHLNLNTTITEQEIENPLEGIPIPGAGESPIGLLQLKEAIRYAETDSKIKGIYLDVSLFRGGLAKGKEIREALKHFKESGKWIIAYSEFYSETSYYIASVADQVYLNPEGELEFNGLAVEVSFFKKLFDKLEIHPEIFRVGEFKSAVEPFMLDKMSDANRMQLKELIENINQHSLSDIASSRKIENTVLADISAHMRVTNPKEAYANHLVDSLVYFDQVQHEIRTRLGFSEEEKIKLIKYGKYKKAVHHDQTSKNEIAVIVADGDILPGKGEDDNIGSDTFAEELRKARTNDRVKAIVLRINSPGGSALASDVMWREVRLASKAKPIIASMSDFAASGGYYLAMGCDSIVAQPNTITGSIGVFSVLFDMSDFLDKKIGITFDEVKTGDAGDLATITRPLTEVEKSIWQKRTNDIYASFTTKAAEGRRMKVDDLRKIASGRVWSGAQAKENGLVDILGDFETAVKAAASKAGIGDDYKLKYYPKRKPFFEQWFSGMEESVKTKALKEELGDNYQILERVKEVKQLQGTQARLPFELQFR